MTSPKHAQQTERGRYYRHPQTGDELISVTNALSALGKPALVPWAAGIVANHAIDNWPRLTAGMRRDRDQVLAELKGAMTVSRDKAADLGSEIHHYAEQHVKADLPIDQMPEHIRPYAAQFLRWLEESGAVVEASECTVASPRRGWAGTLDLLVRLPLTPAIGEFKTPQATTDGTTHLWVVDIKTSATRPVDSVYPEYALQLAALAMADEMWTDDGEVHPVRVRPVGGAVLNLRTGSHRLVPLPIGSAEQDAFSAAVRISRWTHGFKAADHAKASRKPRKTKAQTAPDTTTATETTETSEKEAA